MSGLLPPEEPGAPSDEPGPPPDEPGVDPAEPERTHGRRRWLLVGSAVLALVVLVAVAAVVWSRDGSEDTDVATDADSVSGDETDRGGTDRDEGDGVEGTEKGTGADGGSVDEGPGGAGGSSGGKDGGTTGESPGGDGTSGGSSSGGASNGGGASPTTPTTPTSPPPPAPTLNYSLPPVFGSTVLTAGFLPDPFSVGVTSGGPVDTSYLGGACTGFASAAPSYSVHYTPGAYPTLRCYFIGSGDTTLIINSPAGSYFCVDDSFGTVNPTIDFNAPISGRYDIWVASYAPAASVGGTLYVTENSGNHP